MVVAEKAMEQGVARIEKSREELFDDAYSIIKNSREKLVLFIKKGFVAPHPAKVSIKLNTEKVWQKIRTRTLCNSACMV